MEIYGHRNKIERRSYFNVAGALLIYLFESKARLNWNDEREAFVTPYIFVTFLRFSPRFSQDPLRLAEIVPLKDVYPDLASEH